MQAIPAWALDEGRTRPARSPDVATRDEPSTGAGRAVVCVACRARVTDSAARTERDGHHAHTFFNPAGVTYRVACFEVAPGARGVGGFSDEFSWFAGHRWQVAVCAACGVHLGWLFAGATDFAALIEDRIEEAEQGGD